MHSEVGEEVLGRLCHPPAREGHNDNTPQPCLSLYFSLCQGRSEQDGGQDQSARTDFLKPLQKVGQVENSVKFFCLELAWSLGG